jgi:hypothetical protein
MTVEGNEHVGTYVSSTWATRSFCTTCGATLWYRYDPKQDGGGSFEVPIGLLDDGSGLELKREIFIDAKPDSFAFAGDHARLTGAEITANFSGGG